MTLYEFNQLNLHDQVRFVWDHCKFLLNRPADETHTAALYYRPARLYREEYFVEMCGAAPVVERPEGPHRRTDRPAARLGGIM